ncbi:MAG TPA: phytase [Sphingomicrobium sp.]|nr:phytase [Sphingomicrobium sp.]
MLLCSACAEEEPSKVVLAPAPTVVARGETEPVGTSNADAADDPAIWRNAADPAASLIVATDKKAGLYVYGLDGKPRSFLAAGRLNNVDVLDLRQRGVLVVASDRNDEANAKLQLYRLDPGTAKLVPLGAVTGGKGEAYGVCLWDSGEALYAFSVLKSGQVHQVRIDLGPSPTGSIVRTLRMKTQTEGCVVDPRSRHLYVGEEDVGIWRFAAEPTAPVKGALVAAVDGKQLIADVEGLALATIGTGGGFLLASSQGDNAYALFELPALRPAGRFRVARGKFGSAEETDGIEIALGDFGPDYPGGLLVVQDGENDPRAQNFKLVAWADVVAALAK